MILRPSLMVTTASYGWLAFLSYDSKSHLSTLYKARLHSPVDNICAIRKGTKAKEVHYADGILFLASDNGPLKAIEFLQNSLSPKLQGRKADLADIATNFGIDSTGTMAAIKLRINNHVKELKILYAARKFDGDDIVFSER